jgi:branched-chain amino acid transport system substrate-binding protein
VSELRALLVTPISGPLASYGRAGLAALRLWAEAAELLPPWKNIRLDVRDAHPDPAAAMRRGLAGQPHLIFGPYGSSPSVQALAATERVVWNHGGASSALCWPSFPGTVNVLAPASTYFHGTLEAVRNADPTAARVVIVHGGSGFAADVARGAAEHAARLGFETTVITFSARGADHLASQVPEADLLMVAGNFEDELAAAGVLLEREWPAAAFVGAGVEEVLAPLGKKRAGLLGPAQWIAAAAPEPTEGPDAPWFLARYRSAVGGEPPYPAAQAFAAGILAARCLRDAQTTQDTAQLAAARGLVCRTLLGEFSIDPTTGLQIGHKVLTVQWQAGARRVIWPPEQAEHPLIYPRHRAL